MAHRVTIGDRHHPRARICIDSADAVEEYLAARCQWEDRGYKTQCRIWCGADTASGYGNTRLGGRNWRVHRLAYIAARGEIPEGLELDHLCRVRKCCNPDHLEAVTKGENTLRACAVRYKWDANPPITCRNGHRWDENGHLNSNGRRECRVCANINKRAWKARNRLVAA